jgi:chloramphenicol 3-O-phosphotransferase
MRTSRVVPPCLAWLHSPSDCPHRLSHLETAAASCPAEKGRKEEMRRGEKKGGETRGKDKRRKGMRRHEQIRLDDFR